MEFQSIATRIDELLSRTDGADVRVPEDSALISLAADLVPTVRGLFLNNWTKLLCGTSQRPCRSCTALGLAQFVKPCVSLCTNSN